MPLSVRGVRDAIVRARDSGAGASAGGGGAMPLSLRGESAMPLSLRGEPGFADMEALRAVGAVEALGAAAQLLGIHIPIPSRSFTKRGND